MDEGFFSTSKASLYDGPPRASSICFMQQKLRRIYHTQLLIFIGILLVGFLICAGVGFLFVITVSSRYNIKTLLTRMETLDEKISYLQYNIDAIMEHGSIIKNSSDPPAPVAMKNILPSNFWGKVLSKDSGQASGWTQPKPTMALGPYGRYLMGGLNQTVRSLDKDNRIRLNKLANSVDKLSDSFNIRENEIAKQLYRYSFQLQGLHNIANTLVTASQVNEIKNEINAIRELTRNIDKNQSNFFSSNAITFKQIDSTVNTSLEYFRNSTSDEIIRVREQMQEILTDVESNMADNNKTNRALDEIITRFQTIDTKWENIKNGVGSIHVALGPINEKIDSISSKQKTTIAAYNNFENSLDGVRVKTSEIHDLLNETKQDGSKLRDIILEHATAIHFKVGQLDTFLNTQFLRDSAVHTKTFSDESSSSGFNEKSIHQLETLLNRELKNVLKGIKSVVKGESTFLSSYMLKEFQEYFNKRLQRIEVGLKNDSESIAAKAVLQLQRMIEEQFENGVKTIQSAFSSRSVSPPQTTIQPAKGSPSTATDSVQTSVCLWPHGCTSVEYASKRCFKIVEAKKDALTWFQAKRKCLSMGGHLAEIVNLREYDLLIKSLPSYGNYWLGGTDRGSEGSWHWDHSLQTIFLNSWAPNQPDNKGFIEHCLHILHDEFTVWNDMRCAARLGYICEKEDTTCADWL